MGIEEERAAELISPWVDDPLLFVRECLGAEPDKWQERALGSVYERDRTALVSNKGPGKSCCLAWVIWWFEVTHRDAQTILTSITWDNLRDGVWKELDKWYGKSPLLQQLFEFGKERIEAKDNPRQCWVSPRAWRKDASEQQQADSVAGFHADNTLFVGDEAGGYPLALMATAEASLAGHGCHRIVLAGNPTHTEGYALYTAATSARHLWNVIHVTGDPEDPERSPRVPIEWAKQQIAQFGRDNPWVLVNVFGKFPPASLNVLLGPDEVRAAMSRNPTPDEYDFAQKRLGVDVARFGDDATVIFPRQGLQAFEAVEMRGARTQDIAARVMLAKKTWGSELEAVDATGGYGAGVVDAMIQGGAEPLAVQFSGKATDARFFNKRTEMWWEMAEWVKRGGALPDDPQLARELTTPTYTFQNGKIRLEEKDQIKARLGFSPDRGDALAMTFSLPEMPASVHPVTGMPVREDRKSKCDWDPFTTG